MMCCLYLKISTRWDKPFSTLLTFTVVQPQGPQTIIEPLQSTAPLHEEEEADGQSTIEDSPSPQDSPHGFIMSG